MPKKCIYCGRELPGRQRKYCNDTCKEFYKNEGAMVGSDDVPIINGYAKQENPDLELTKTGLWMLVSAKYDDQKCIGDFMRTWKRAPKHVIFDPRTPFWKFVGPVYTKEQLAHRWRESKR